MQDDCIVVALGLPQRFDNPHRSNIRKIIHYYPPDWLSFSPSQAIER